MAVYIARPEGASFFKVGHSAALETRVRALATAYGPVRVASAPSDDPRADERRILQALQQHRRPHGSGRASETVQCGRRDAVYRRALDMLQEIQNGHEFQVRSIRDVRVRGGKGSDPQLQFLVVWEGYGPDEDSWEPLENLRELRALDEFANTRRWARACRDMQLADKFPGLDLLVL